jgi:DNA polymerase-3 subunit delta
MFLFFHGDNEFLLEKKLKELKAKYRQKSGGDLNLITFEGENLNCEEFLTQAQIIPLLATSRLIVVKNVFRCKNKNCLDRIKDFLLKIPTTTVIVLTHVGKIDGRLGLYKELKRSKDAHEFKIIDQSQQVSYVKREVERLGSRIGDVAARLLVEYCQGNLFILSSEIEKLVLYKYKNEINSTDVEGMVSRGSFPDVFVMIDSLSEGRTDKALEELEKLYANGEAGLRIMAMINYQYRLIAQVKEAQEKTSNPFQASKLSGVSYFQAKKVFEIAKKISWNELYDKYTQIMLFDENIKTGKINEEEGVKGLVIKIR